MLGPLAWPLRAPGCGLHRGRTRWVGRGDCRARAEAHPCPSCQAPPVPAPFRTGPPEPHSAPRRDTASGPQACFTGGEGRLREGLGPTQGHTKETGQNPRPPSLTCHQFCPPHAPLPQWVEREAGTPTSPRAHREGASSSVLPTCSRRGHRDEAPREHMSHFQVMMTLGTPLRVSARAGRVIAESRRRGVGRCGQCPPGVVASD